MKKNAADYYGDYSNGFMREGLTGFIFSKVNRMIEKKFNKNTYFENILELAATDYNHVGYVKCQYKKYIVSDIDTKNFKLTNPPNEKIDVLCVDAKDLRQFSNDQFDRIIVTCLVQHLEGMNHALREWRRVLRPGGYISIYVSCEPGFLLRGSRFLLNQSRARYSLRKKQSRYDHLAFVYAEHKSYYLAVKYAIKEIFEKDLVDTAAFPFRFLSWNFNLWKIYTIKKDGGDEIEEFLQ